MNNIDLSQADWRTSSRSANGQSCVEVAFVKKWLTRDSKRPTGGVLVFSPDEWSAFVRRAGDDEFNRP